ncbi:MAG: acyl-CoA dehydrogenase [Steroidobacteraceae bacterium]
MTSSYKAPVADLEFLFDRVLDMAALRALPAFAAVDEEVVRGVLAEGARFAEGVLAPINAAGDEQASRLVEGRVRYSPGFAQAYAKYCEGGWAGFDLPADLGGQGMPRVLQAAFAEMSNGANLAFSMLPVTMRAAARLLMAHGSEEQVKRWVPGMIDGSIATTIVITEPQAGSDVGRARSLATPQADGTYRLTGTKVFISNADNEFTPQIVHMVLARTPGAPAGTRGISLFLVPQVLEDGRRNTVRVARVEHKMGLRASPTCVVEFEDAQALRIGEAGRGLQAMFAMVNTMRLEVAVQGVGIGGAALNRAVQHALERTQGGAPDQPPRAIIEHPDVRRMLLTMRARVEGLRALVLEAALQIDLGENHPQPSVAAKAAGFAQWLLPICKACSTDMGFEVASTAIQVFGGYGYITDTGVEQYARDVRVGAIYEGTNGIQAIDLVTRKLIADRATRLSEFVEAMRTSVKATAAEPAVDAIREGVAKGADLLELVSRELLARAGQSRAADIEAGAVPYLKLAGLVGGAWMWLRMAAAAGEATPLHQGKRATARFYAQVLLPEAELLARQALLGTGAAGGLGRDHWAAGW